MFPLRSSGEGSAVATHALAATLETHELHNIKWAEIKRPERAVQKIVRSYNGDTSRLVDVSRENIVFENVEDLIRCLEVVDADPSAKVVRIKNRLDFSYNAMLTSGYRDVVMNLRLTTDLTRRLGIEEHVCELQLILRSYAELRSDEGHKRYVESRDER
eukprot:CAMPEP_0181310446 /NCGR_PEP_ID=MMETSP1101-20121128/12590_1 /TAXON_ID=46948 /ORGANISM="Rhodomonas abbreviata, Strain Caron Lab Isolate" /LENGTH=158 /DNA_ID=CAMNT_0023417075 /DNA_START=171 /DNA_END=644 /DNA_ORIENTATION=-